MLRSAAHSESFRWLFAGWTFIYLPVYAVLAYLVLYVAAQPGLSSATGSWLLSVIGGSTGLARLGVGPISDRIGRTKTFIITSFLLDLSVVILPAMSSITTLTGFALLFGAAYGGNGALLAPVLADVFGTAHISALFGGVSVAFAFQGFSHPILLDSPIKLWGSYWIAFAGFGIIALLGAVCTIVGVRSEHIVDV